MTTRRITVREVLDATAAVTGVSRAELVSQRRGRALSRKRQIAMAVATELTGRTNAEIDRLIGGRDHTTVRHGVGRIGRLVDVDPELAATVEAVRERVAQMRPAVPWRERDPLRVAIDLATGERPATDISVDEMLAVARCLVGYGRRLGTVTLEDDGDIDGDMQPLAVVDPAVLTAIDGVTTAWNAFETATYGSRERVARADLARAIKALIEVRQEAE